VETLATERDGLQEEVKATKPKKEKAERPSKYEYPADCVTADQKKKFRASKRAEAKKADKPAKAEKVKTEKVKAEKTKEEAVPAESETKKEKKVVKSED